MAKTFFFHGQGVGLGGVVTRPFQRSLEAQAGASLPITGGKAYGNRGPYNVPNPGNPDIVSIQSAETTVTGELVGSVYRTEVTTIVTKLSVRDIVTADNIVANIISEHDPSNPEPSIRFTGSKIDNLRINGQEVKVDIDDTLFTDQGTYSKFKKMFDDGDAGFKKDLRKRFLWGDLNPDEVPDCWREQYDFAQKQKSLPMAQGLVPCSIVKGASAGGGYQAYRHILTIPDFGAIFLGEVLMQDYARRLTMMRIHLGCPVEGDISIAGADVNGSAYP